MDGGSVRDILLIRKSGLVYSKSLQFVAHSRIPKPQNPKAPSPYSKHRCAKLLRRLTSVRFRAKTQLIPGNLGERPKAPFPHHRSRQSIPTKKLSCPRQDKFAHLLRRPISHCDFTLAGRSDEGPTQILKFSYIDTYKLSCIAE